MCSKRTVLLTATVGIDLQDVLSKLMNVSQDKYIDFKPKITCMEHGTGKLT